MKIKYDDSIYSEQAIVCAANIYSHIVKITIKHDGNSIECSFEDCRYDVVTTIKEFSNYIIDRMNQEK